MILGDLAGAEVLFAYYLIFAFFLPTLSKAAGVPTEWVRKSQHVVYSLSVFLLLSLFSAWYWAVLAASLLAVVAYPTLWAIEKHPRYRQLFVDRTVLGGELRKQLIYVQLTFALLLLIFWGLGTRWHYVVAAEPSDLGHRGPGVRGRGAVLAEGYRYVDRAARCGRLNPVRGLDLRVAGVVGWPPSLHSPRSRWPAARGPFWPPCC